MPLPSQPEESSTPDPPHQSDNSSDGSKSSEDDSPAPSPNILTALKARTTTFIYSTVLETHICNDCNVFCPDFREIDQEAPDGTRIMGIGSVEIILPVTPPAGEMKFRLTNVLYVPDAPISYVSRARLDRCGPGYGRRRHLWTLAGYVEYLENVIKGPHLEAPEPLDRWPVYGWLIC